LKITGCEGKHYSSFNPSRDAILNLSWRAIKRLIYYPLPVAEQIQNQKELSFFILLATSCKRIADELLLSSSFVLAASKEIH